jgi:uncharacterized protein
MPLSEADIGRIRELGIKEDDFCEQSEDSGWMILKNIDGRCIFHDGDGCEIYGDRPDGCKLYPVIYDPETKEAVIDWECPFGHEFLITEKDRKDLFDLVERIILEGETRKEFVQKYEEVGFEPVKRDMPKKEDDEK